MTHDPVPPLLLERLARGDLPPADAAKLRERLGPDADAAVAALYADDAATDVDTFAAANQRRLADARASRRRRRALWLAPALAGACVLLLWRAAPGPTPTHHLSHEPDAGPGDRIKGLQPHLRAYRRGPDGPEALADGATVRPGALVQLSYVGAGRKFGAVLSLDDRGVVTVHWPESGAAAPLLSATGETLLPSAYELDDSPRFERFLLISRAEPFALAPVVAMAQALAADPERAAREPLALPADHAQASLLLRKEPP
jgi:anti-sigma factor RsiW